MKDLPIELNLQILTNFVEKNLNINHLATVSKSWFTLFKENENLNKAYEIRRRVKHLLALSQWHLPEETLNVEFWHQDFASLLSNKELSDEDLYYEDLSYEDHEQNADPVKSHVQNELGLIFNGQYDAEIISYMKQAYPIHFNAEKIMAPLFQCCWEYCFIYDLIQIDASVAIDALIKEDLFDVECTDCNGLTLLEFETFDLSSLENSKPKSFDILVKYSKKYDFDARSTSDVYSYDPSLKNHPVLHECIKSLIRHQVKTSNALIYLVNNDEALLRKLIEDVSNESKNLPQPPVLEIGFLLS